MVSSSLMAAAIGVVIGKFKMEKWHQRGQEESRVAYLLYCSGILGLYQLLRSNAFPVSRPVPRKGSFFEEQLPIA